MTFEEFVAVNTLMLRVENPVIVELGAYMGEDSPNFEKIVNGQEFLHIMVEPDFRNQAAIAENSDRPLNGNRRLVSGAIGSTPGVRYFRPSFDSRDGSRGSGSILEPTGHNEHFPTIKFDEPQAVQCFTLDQIFADNELEKIDLLWVDIQGAEKEMIAGGKEALEHTRFCFMEAESIEMYSGQALKPELISLLPDWRLIKDFGFNILLENLRFEE